MSELVAALGRIAPLELAEDWDNTGVLLSPSIAPEVERVLLTIDLTAAVAEEAIEASAQLIVAYHPPIFSGLKKLVPTDRTARLAILLLERGIAVYSPHTALDSTPGGVNDWLCDAFGPGQRTAIEPAELSTEWEPTGALPTDGPMEALIGQGRRVELTQPLSLQDALYRVKQHLGLQGVRLAVAPEHAHGSEIRSVGVCAGAGGSVLANCQADLLLTGEMRHHDVLARVETGTSVILTEHTNSERGYLPRLKARLEGIFPELSVTLSARDKDPLTIA